MALEAPGPDEVCEELQMRSAVFIEKIRALLGMQPDQYLHVGFDEVGVLHSRHKFFDLEDSSGRLGPFNDFFGIVRKFCRWSFRGIGWDDILDEIGKFLIPVSDQILSKNPKVHCMLVILSTKLAYNVAAELSR
ncbi:hypothetical protein GAYE_HTGSCF06PCTG21G0269 [Galdieria yellowstonensis]|uniref:Beta-N-acetylhexosaminidase n=1 Tax=Galdieria yellowstonensis TaxID=3028027 RepID=A0AAV9I7A5_9RHOD|nr:hypothetical protein GAYE_HTGSCF06PCTG21G0269 [Galdieria yellowstonensis]